MSKTLIYTVLIIVVLVGGYFLFSNKGAPKDTLPPSLSDQYGSGGGQPASPTDVPPINNTNDKQKIMNAILHTNKGDITIEFRAEGTPNTVANFQKLAKEGFYDGVKFHRVIKGFMIQGGDPLTKDDSKMAMWGTGGPGYRFADELDANNHNNTYTIAMANAGPNTNGSQFFINTADNNFLDGKHTVFGKVTAGMDVVKAIESVETTTGDRPKDAVIIKNITLN